MEVRGRRVWFVVYGSITGNGVGSARGNWLAHMPANI